MVGVGPLVRGARREAGLSQEALAERLGTTQSAIARLESKGANPRVNTLERVLGATGYRLVIDARRHEPQLDEGQIATYLRLTPAERLAAFRAAYRGVKDLVDRARPPDGKVA